MDKYKKQAIQEAQDEEQIQKIEEEVIYQQKEVLRNRKRLELKYANVMTDET